MAFFVSNIMLKTQMFTIGFNTLKEQNVNPLLSLLRCVSNINHKEAKIYIFWKDELECDNKKKKNRLLKKH